MKREPTPWERDVLAALVSVDNPSPYAPDVAALRESLPHLVVTGGCGCGCGCIFVRDHRMSTSGREIGSYHFSNAVTRDGRISMFLLVKDERPWSVDVMLPPDLDGSEPESRPDVATLIVSSAKA